MKQKVYIQCGYEDKCKKKDCLHCKHKLALTNTKLTLAEATSIEDFAVVDIESWLKENPEQLELQQNVMRKMMNRIVWERKGRWLRKVKRVFK